MMRAERLLPLAAWVCFLTFAPDALNVGEGAVLTLACVAVALAAQLFNAERELICRQHLADLYVQDLLPVPLRETARAYLAGADNIDPHELYQVFRLAAQHADRHR